MMKLVYEESAQNEESKGASGGDSEITYEALQHT